MSWTAECRKSSQHVLSMWELLQDGWKSIAGEAGWENAKCAKLSSRQMVATLKNLKYKIHFDLFSTFSVTTWFYMCYFIVLMSSLLFYDVEISKNKLEIVGPNLTGTIYNLYIYIFIYTLYIYIYTHTLCLRKVYRPLDYFQILLSYNLVLKLIQNNTKSSPIYTQYPIMTNGKQLFRNVCKCIKN